MNETVICLGSNTSDGESLIAEALSRMSGCFRISATSGIYTTIDEKSGQEYFNEVVRGLTADGEARLNSFLKQIELSLGRNQESRKAGIVPIDIDIIIFNGRIVRRQDYSKPYFTKGFDIVSDINTK